LVTPLYRLRALRKAYGRPGAPDPRLVLDVEALDIQAGELLAVVGPSGAGKSTLLRLLNFLEPPTSGSLEFDGQPVPTSPPLALLRRVTTVFQRPLMLSRSVADNVAFGLRLRGLPVDGRVAAILAEVGLAALAGAPAGQLSGGEMQRAALARALVLDPAALLLDEPTANLDPHNVGLIETSLLRHRQARGATLVLVTHNVFQARRLAGQAGGRVALLLAGRLVEVAPADDFFARPQDPRTAAFIRGDMVY
jgi:tungstate transport system ATP-binding protein